MLLELQQTKVPSTFEEKENSGISNPIPPQRRRQATGVDIDPKDNNFNNKNSSRAVLMRVLSNWRVWKENIEDKFISVVSHIVALWGSPSCLSIILILRPTLFLSTWLQKWCMFSFSFSTVYCLDEKLISFPFFLEGETKERKCCTGSWVQNLGLTWDRNVLDRWKPSDLY